MKRFLLGLADLVFPPHCHGCGEPLIELSQDFCVQCRESLLFNLDPYCYRCGSPGGESDLREDGCFECRGRRLPWDRVIRNGVYEGGLRKLILQCKGRGGEGLALALGREWGRNCRNKLTDYQQALYFPIPRHWMKSWWIGQNPAEGIAKGLTAILGANLVTNRLIRNRPTRKQADLPKSLRRRNVRGAFEWLGPEVDSDKNLKAVIVDDILTTGATAYYAAKALKSAGFTEIIVAVLARGKSRMTGLFGG